MIQIARFKAQLGGLGVFDRDQDELIECDIEQREIGVLFQNQPGARLPFADAVGARGHRRFGRELTTRRLNRGFGQDDAAGCGQGGGEQGREGRFQQDGAAIATGHLDMIQLRPIRRIGRLYRRIRDAFPGEFGILGGHFAIFAGIEDALIQLKADMGVIDHIQRFQRQWQSVEFIRAGLELHCEGEDAFHHQRIRARSPEGRIEIRDIGIKPCAKATAFRADLGQSRVAAQRKPRCPERK